LINYVRQEVVEVRLELSARYAVTREISRRYKKAGKREKGLILNGFLKLTGYHRKYAIHILTNWGKRKLVGQDGETIQAIAGKRRKSYTRAPTYTIGVKTALVKVWKIYGCICGKRLRSVLKGQMRVLRNCRTFSFSEPVWDKLSKVSAGTIDRMLKSERTTMAIKGRSYTKPGSMLKHHIPVRRGSDWDDAVPGYFEIDLVGHDGGNSSGDFSFSLNMTDVATGWTEPVALKNKAQKWTFEGIVAVEKRIPMKLRGIDSDNGSEFINFHLYNYCQEEKIEFTRSRPNRKNDNCYVEQKNYSVIRRYAGYFRYDTEEEVALLNELYAQVRLQINYFLPSMKLLEKVRVGSKVIKRYDEAKTPFQRVLETGVLNGDAKAKVEKEFSGLNPVIIQRKICDIQDKLEKLVIRKQRAVKSDYVRKAN
jgi:hypothetical protein